MILAVTVGGIAVTPAQADGTIMRSLATGRCLDSNYAGYAYTLPCNGGAYQSWQRVGDGNGREIIKNAQTGMCLAANAVGSLYTAACASA
ncbi:hypothetical protein ACFVXB_43715, partial [Streptomyces sp. NPDC058247]